MKSFNQSQENGTHLTLCCQVSSTVFANFSIQWHHTDSMHPLPSKESDIKNTIIVVPTNQTVMTSIWRSEGISLVWSKLTIHIEEKNTGLYWCSVKSNDNGTFIPSTVLNISSVEDIQLQTCNCDDGPIVDTSLFSKLHCTYGNVSEMEPQSSECQQTDQDKTLMPPSTNTVTVEDLKTTTPSEIDTDNGTAPSEIGTDNGSTIEEGTAESLTVLPTKLSSSTTQETTVTVEITTNSEKEHDDTTQVTYAPDTEGPATAETPRRDQLNKIMLNFIVGKLSHLPSPSLQNLLCIKVLLYCFIFIHSYSYSCCIISDPLIVSHNWNLSQKAVKDERKASEATGSACHYNKRTSRCVQHDNKDQAGV